MATHTVQIKCKETLDGGRMQVAYCDPASPGVQYVVEAASDADADVAEAIAAQIEARRAAGLDYPGMPASAEPVLDVVTG